MIVNEFPTKCNVCGGDVIYTTNDNIYGKKYGSGYCYYCTNCGAYVGTHKPYPKKALGLLANNEMRKWKIMCHDLFDSMWKGKVGQKRIRAQLYKKLANELGISVVECHFGWFDLPMLKRAYNILTNWKNKVLERALDIAFEMIDPDGNLATHKDEIIHQAEKEIDEEEWDESSQ